LVSRFLKILEDQKGHEIASRVEGAKITLSDLSDAVIDMGFIEDDWAISATRADLATATEADVLKVISTARSTVEQGAGIDASTIDTIFMTGGSTALPQFVDKVQAAFPSARMMQGDRFSSVATGLGVSAARLYRE